MNYSKSLLAIGLSIVFFTSCKPTDSESITEINAKAVVASENNATTVTKLETASFNIEGMTCAIGCAKTIEKELSEMEGVQKATVDFDKKLATVSFDATKQTAETLVKVVEATADGKTYTVSNVKSSGNKAMLFIQEQEKEKKKSCSSDSKKAKNGKGCCSKKKSCKKEEQKESTI